jgi:signal transduction histidine kinase
MVRRVVSWWGGVVGGLNPAGGAALPPLPGVPPVLAWLPHVALLVAAVALGVVAAGQVGGATAVPGGAAEQAGGGSSVLLPVALGAAQGLPLALAPVRPVAAFWVSILVGTLVSETVRAGGAGSVWAEPSLLTHLGVLAVAGLGVRARVLPALWLVTLLAGAVLVQRMPGMNASPDLVEMSTLSAVVLVAAGALRGRREALRRLADQERISHAERLHRSVLEERARIARELHDVVAHHMSLIAVQAEAAPYRVADAPPELTRSFATIRASAVEAITELRRVLGLLRGPAEVGATEAPQPRLADLPGLVATVRAAGVAAELSVTGGARPLDPGVELSAYRIVQEALSNALRHAPDAEVRVDVGYTGTALTVGVVNSRPPASGPAIGRPPTSGLGNGRPATDGPVGSEGHGLVGMRERVAMLGGQLAVGPRPDGGYAVMAVLPTGPSGGEG